jgi:hypothetical protein
MLQISLTEMSLTSITQPNRSLLPNRLLLSAPMSTPCPIYLTREFTNTYQSMHARKADARFVVRAYGSIEYCFVSRSMIRQNRSKIKCSFGK